MNKQQIIQELQEKYPGKPIICLPEEDPTEIICEIGPIEGGSRAIAVIDESVLHFHLRTTEVYKVLKGQLTVEYDSSDKACVLNLKDKVLNEGDTFKIYPGTVHKAKGDACWVEVDAFPAWSPEDHYLVECED